MKNITILSVGIGGFANNYLSKMFPDHGNGFEIVGAVEPFPNPANVWKNLKQETFPYIRTLKSFMPIIQQTSP